MSLPRPRDQPGRWTIWRRGVGRPGALLPVGPSPAPALACRVALVQLSDPGGRAGPDEMMAAGGPGRHPFAHAARPDCGMHPGRPAEGREARTGAAEPARTDADREFLARRAG